uniref:Uncharacterized protein n=1 Tax=Lepeophtheirus salmonis TaxID=72036 RepID=A0A0K2THI7_LEPSM
MRQKRRVYCFNMLGVVNIKKDIVGDRSLRCSSFKHRFETIQKASLKK